MSAQAPHGPAPEALTEIIAHTLTAGTPEQVWLAWENPDALRAWWSPGGTVVSSSTVQLNPGGTLDVLSHAPGRTLQVLGQVLTADRPHSFTTTWLWARADDQIAARPGTVTLTCQPAAGGTDVTVIHHGLTDPVARQRNTEGWTHALQGLTAYLDDQPAEHPH